MQNDTSEDYELGQDIPENEPVQQDQEVDDAEDKELLHAAKICMQRPYVKGQGKSMKRLLVLWVSIWILLTMPGYVQAQGGTTTPNLGLSIPAYESGTWGELIANDLTIIDSKFPGGVAGGVQNKTCTGNDKISSIINGVATCTADVGGSALNFNQIVSGTNTTAAMVVGTGASLTTSGSGTIVATSVAAFSGTPTLCTAGNAGLGILANGNATGCTKYLPEPTGPPGIPYLTAANTTITRVPIGTANRIVITNGNGFAGPPQWDVGVNIPALTPTNNTVPVGNGAAWIGAIFVDCPNSGGNVSQWNATTKTLGCNVLSGGGGGGITGLTTNTVPLASSPTSLADSPITKTVTPSINISVPLEIGTVATDSYDINSASVAGHGHVVLTIPFVGAGNFAFTTGALVNGNCAKFDANGRIIDNGGVCAGGFQKYYWDGGAVSIPAASTCGAQAINLVNSGPTIVTTLCTSANTSTFEGQIALTQALTTFTMSLTVNDTLALSHHYFGAFSAQCRGTGTAVNNTWGTGVNVDLTLATANNNVTVTSGNITPNGSCTNGAILFWRFVKNTATDTDAGTGRLIGVQFLQTS